jgi:hypothetical protein
MTVLVSNGCLLRFKPASGATGQARAGKSGPPIRVVGWRHTWRAARREVIGAEGLHFEAQGGKERAELRAALR